MRKEKLSEFIYFVDLVHDQAEYGVYNFKRFFDRKEALDYCEKLAVGNPDITVSISIRPRITKKNLLTAG